MDEERFGTHSKQGHGWFPKGQRSRVNVKLGFENFYMYSAVECATGNHFTLFLAKANSKMMNIFLSKLAQEYAGQEVMVIMDGAGWHKSKELIIPENIEILHLPPYSPELNPVERLWLHIKSNILKNKVYETLDALEEAACDFIKNMLNETVAKICILDWFS